MRADKTVPTCISLTGESIIAMNLRILSNSSEHISVIFRLDSNSFSKTFITITNSCCCIVTANRRRDAFMGDTLFSLLLFPPLFDVDVSSMRSGEEEPIKKGEIIPRRKIRGRVVTIGPMTVERRIVGRTSEMISMKDVIGRRKTATVPSSEKVVLLEFDR
jgi:hypothetical protein